jgi:hypothetical protein
MIKVYQDREFHSFIDRNSGKTFSDLKFRKCHFVGCWVSTTRDPRRRSIVRNVEILDCEQHGCTLDAAIVEDVLVNGIKTHGLFQTWGTVFRHVIVQGKIGRLMTSPLIATAMGTPAQQKAFDEANSVYYSRVDWALDIREAQFEEADLRGIPTKLVLRDPETQFIITREKALEHKWKDVDLTGTHWRTAIELFLETGVRDEVFVAPKRSPRFRALLGGLWALRDAGVIE